MRKGRNEETVVRNLGYTGNVWDVYSYVSKDVSVTMTGWGMGKTTGTLAVRS